MAKTFKCPYCGTVFPDAVSRSQHVRDCPDRGDPRRFRVIGPRALPLADAHGGRISLRFRHGFT